MASKSTSGKSSQGNSTSAGPDISGPQFNELDVPTTSTLINLHNQLKGFRVSVPSIDQAVDDSPARNVLLSALDEYDLFVANSLEFATLRESPLDFSLGSAIHSKAHLSTRPQSPSTEQYSRIDSVEYRTLVLHHFQNLRALGESEFNEDIPYTTEISAQLILLRQLSIAELVTTEGIGQERLEEIVLQLLEVDRNLEKRSLQNPRAHNFTVLLTATTYITLIECGIPPEVIREIELRRLPISSEIDGKIWITDRMKALVREKFRHTRLDHLFNYISSRLSLEDSTPLSPLFEELLKLQSWAPISPANTHEILSQSNPYDYDYLVTDNYQKSPRRFFQLLDHCRATNPKGFEQFLEVGGFQILVELSKSTVQLIRDRALQVFVANFEHVSTNALTTVITNHYWDKEVNKPADKKDGYEALIRKLYELLKDPNFAPNHKERLLSVIREIAVQFITESAGGADQDVRGLRLPAVESLLENLSQSDLSKLALIKLDPPIMFEAYGGIMESSQLGSSIAFSLMIIPDPNDTRYAFRRKPQQHVNLYRVLKNYDLVKAEKESTEFFPNKETPLGGRS